MLKKIIGTTGTRILNAFINLVVLIIITNYIGSEGLGVIGLILVDITIIQLSVDLVAGSSLVYFASRANTGQLIIPAYGFVILVLLFYFAAGNLVLYISPQLFHTVVPEGYFMDILGLSVLGSLMWIHYNLLLGKSRISTYNILFSLQVLIFLITFVSFVFFLNDPSVHAYVYALYVSYGLAALTGLVSILYRSGPIRSQGWTRIIGQVFRYGLVTQAANLLSIGNNRLSFYFIKYFAGLPALGIYNAGIQTTEGFKLIGQSIAVVQFSAIANARDSGYARILTIRLMKVSMLLTLAAVIVINVLPEAFYTWLFGKDFEGVKPVIMALSPGVLALAANNIFSHYFSGMGNPKVNLLAKLTGFIFTVILAIVLIPPYGFIGAALTASVSYIATVVHQYRQFSKDTRTKAKEWMPARNDIREFRRIVREALSGSDQNTNDRVR